jgi:hypothetical protein
MFRWVTRIAMLWLVQRLAREYIEPANKQPPRRKRRAATR